MAATAVSELRFYDVPTGADLRGDWRLVDGEDLHRIGADLGDGLELCVTAGRVPAGLLGWLQLRVAVGVRRRGHARPLRRPTDAELRAVQRLYSKVTLLEDLQHQEHHLIRHLLQPLNT